MKFSFITHSISQTAIPVATSANHFRSALRKIAEVSKRWKASNIRVLTVNNIPFGLMT
jgi:hypothetical protein